jgi:hypothetical protein
MASLIIEFLPGLWNHTETANRARLSKYAEVTFGLLGSATELNQLIVDSFSLLVVDHRSTPSKTYITM